MKLRNKKTGEIWDIGKVLVNDYPCWETLTQICEDWEDVKEPLIKDEAKRSVFKAWAEILGRDLEKADFKYDAERNGFDCYLAESIIEFANGEGINCVDREIYTFRALCGEGEE